MIVKLRLIADRLRQEDVSVIPDPLLTALGGGESHGIRASVGTIGVGGRRGRGGRGEGREERGRAGEERGREEGRGIIGGGGRDKRT